MMGDHLVQEERQFRFGRNLGGHANHHMTIHSINTRGKFLHGFFRIAHESAGTFRMGQLELIQSVGLAVVAASIPNSSMIRWGSVREKK